MKAFRNYISEVRRIEWEGQQGGGDTEKGSDRISRAKKAAKTKTTKYHRIGNVGDFAMWAGLDNSGKYLHVDIIHRPSNTLAGVASISAVKRENGKYWKVDTVDVHKDFRKSRVGHSVAVDLYKKLQDVGQSIESSDVQTKGGESIWRRMLKNPKLRKQARLVKIGDKWKANVTKWKQGDERKVWDQKSKRPEDTSVAFVPSKRAKFGLPPEEKTKQHAKKLYKPSTVWKTRNGKWGAKTRSGAFEYFDDQRSAEKWAKR